MKLAFCLFNYFPFGGLQRDFLRIAKECIARNHSVDVFTMEWEGEQDPDLRLHVIPSRGWQNHTRIQHYVTELKRRLKKDAYDLVVGFNKIPGLDLYYAADTCYQARARKKHHFLYRLLPRYRQLVNYEKSIFEEKSHTQILLISPLQQVEFCKYYNTPLSRFHLLPPGISKDRCAPENAEDIRMETRRAFEIKENHFLIVMIGSGFKTKGLDRILHGIAALTSEVKQCARLFIIGDDHSEPFKKLAHQLNILPQVTFLGGRHDLPRFLLAADLLVHPAYSENTGTVLLEAMVSGLPVLTTDVCGYAHYVRDANAGMVLSSPFEQNQFNQALESMLLSTDRSIWHKNGLQFAKTADIYNLPQHAVEKIESLRT